MSGVFANGLEISGKARAGPDDRRLPRRLLHPAAEPRDAAGVPVPYPSFGMAGDTDKGTGTVMIGGKTVNIKNKSDESKTHRQRGRMRAEEGRHHLEEHRQEVLQCLVERREVRRRAGHPVHGHRDHTTTCRLGPNAPPWVEIAETEGSGRSVPRPTKNAMTKYDPNECWSLNTRRTAYDDALLPEPGARQDSSRTRILRNRRSVERAGRRCATCSNRPARRELPRRTTPHACASRTTSHDPTQQHARRGADECAQLPRTKPGQPEPELQEMRPTRRPVQAGAR